MQYLITFLEGIISFISPCMLPMLPIYIMYFAGGADKRTGRVLPRAISFVLGFTLVFCTLGLFAGSIGSLLTQHETAVNAVCGLVVIFFGLSYIGIIPINFVSKFSEGKDVNSILSAFIFGIIYSVSITPCIGAFLGSALMLAATAGGAAKGTLLLLVYSLGLGIPFAISAVLIEKLNGTFQFIKSHYGIINRICGIFLIVIGICMAFGWLGRFMSILS